MKIILASSSPQRKRILEELGVRFQAIASHIKETHDGRKRPHAIARHLAFKKAQTVAKKNPKSWVLGADTLVVNSKGEITGKPKNKKEAFKILKKYSQSHCDVYSGIALINHVQKKSFISYEKTRLYFRKLSDQEIKDYIKANTQKCLNSSGAMTIEGLGEKWITQIKGDYWNVVGLPVNEFKKLLARAKQL